MVVDDNGSAAQWRRRRCGGKVEVWQPYVVVEWRREEEKGDIWVVKWKKNGEKYEEQRGGHIMNKLKI